MNEVFQLKDNLQYCFKSQNVRTVHYGTESLRFLGPKIWSIIPSNFTELKSLNEFKHSIKNWKPYQCPCRLCKIYISGIGFISDEDIGINVYPLKLIFNVIIDL